AVLPGELLLAPGLLLPVLDVRELAGLALHEDVAAGGEQRRLVVHQQVTGGIGTLLLLGGERVVDDVREDRAAGLSRDGYGPLVQRRAAPLAPPCGRRISGGQSGRHYGRAETRQHQLGSRCAHFPLLIARSRDRLAPARWSMSAERL